jgi:hypothetical protein
MLFSILNRLTVVALLAVKELLVMPVALTGSWGRRTRAYVQAGWTSLMSGHDNRLRFKDWTVSGVEPLSPPVLETREAEDEAWAW